MVNQNPVRRVLIYRIGSLGDTVVSLPCLHLIARKFPSAQRVLLSNFPINAKAPPASAVLHGSGLIHGYMRYAVGTRSPLELSVLWWKIIRFRPDVLVYLMPARNERDVRRDAAFFRLCGVRRIVGLPVSGEPFHILDEKTGLYQKEASRLARAIAELGEAKPEALESWDLQLTPDERATAVRALTTFRGRPLIVCGPCTKFQSKDWGVDNWSALLGRLSVELPAHTLALVGASEDAKVAEGLRTAWPGNSLNLCGQLNPRETAAVMEHGDLYLGPDSGPMHLAAAVGVPCASAFSAQVEPGIWFPIGEGNRIVYHKTDCFGCHLETCIERKRECLTTITVAEMYAAAMSALQSASDRRLKLSI
jgi:heptosyltransferase-3